MRTCYSEAAIFLPYAHVCKSCSETTYHLFFEYAFALNLSAWFGSILNSSIQINSMDDIWIIMNKNWSPQCKMVIKACFINILNVIWFNRKQSRFQDKFLGWRPAINLIIAKVALSGNNTVKSSSISMQEFSILKACNVSVKPPRAPIIREVVWTPPLSPWIKINTDGACVKNPVKASIGGIFRNNEGCCVGCFAQSLGDGNALVKHY